MSLIIDLFLTFAKIGLFTFGGGYAMISLIERTCAETKGWITREEVMNVTVLAESTPGPVAINCATFVGYKKKGLLGSIVSTLGVTIPSFVLIMIIARGITALGDSGVVMGAMAGLRAAALGMVAVAMIQLTPAAIKNKWALLAAVAAFVLIAVLRINTAYVILLFAVIGIAVTLAGGGESE